MPNVDWAAHVAGLVAGALLGMLAFGGAAKRPWLVRTTGGVAFLGLSAAGVAALLTGVVVPPRELLLYCTYVVRPAYPQYVTQVRERCKDGPARVSSSSGRKHGALPHYPLSSIHLLTLPSTPPSQCFGN